MVHECFEFPMPARADVVFDAFHYHLWRSRWDSLVHATRVLDGAPCPYVGAVTDNAGGGWLRMLSMRTRFIAFERPRLAAAAMQGHSFPFARWAASMRHRPMDNGHSVLVYTYSFETRPRALRWLMEPATKWMFDRQTHRRFARMRDFLAGHAGEVEAWQARAERGQD
jgi:hypothetical protein